MKNLVRLVPALAAALCFAACSSTPDTSAIDAACSDYFSAVLESVTACGSGSGVTASDKSLFLRVCSSSAAAPGSGIGTTFLSNCAAAFRSSVANNCTESSALEEACRPPAGTLPGKSACREDTQCASAECIRVATNGEAEAPTCGSCAPAAKQGEACSVDTTDLMGARCIPGLVCKDSTCQPKVKLGEGDSCLQQSGGSTTYLACGDNLYCKSDASASPATATCTARGALGAACGGSSGGVCQAALRCVANKCSEPSGDGGPCPTGSECDVKLSCNGKTRKCEPRPSNLAAGAECGSSSECAAGLTCISSGSDAPQTCTAPLGEGAACAPLGQEGYVPCALGLTCTGGKCTFIDPAQCK